MVAGAEGERCLDLDGKLVRRDAVAVVAAVHDEAAGRYRDEIFEARLDPVLGLDNVEDERFGDLVSCRSYNEFPQPCLIGRLGEMERDVPLSVRPLEGGDRRIAVEKTSVSTSTTRLAAASVPIEKQAR